jgi:hypothetical protein
MIVEIAKTSSAHFTIRGRLAFEPVAEPSPLVALSLRNIHDSGRSKKWAKHEIHWFYYISYYHRSSARPKW